MTALTQLVSRMGVSNLQEHLKTRKALIGIEDLKDVEAHEELRTTGIVVSRTEVLGVPFGQEKALRLTIQETLLESLGFPSMNNRYKEVIEAYRETLEWIFQDSTTTQLPWDCFIDWLGQGSGVYWINGKAGSGKSTLMRYLCDDPRTKKHLREWAKDIPLQVVSFFFWNSGTREQRSQDGLLQAILFEVLHAEPQLIPIILPTEWARSYSRPAQGLPNKAQTVWSQSKLVSAFKLLVKQTFVPLRLCLIIDGLDEYEGEHEEIAKLFKEVTRSSNVKACLSSRPWVVFKDCFKSFPCLRLQDMTRGDIQLFTEGKLNDNDLFISLQHREPEQASALLLEIVDKANGVFLWVRIVVYSLLKGLRARDGLEDLQQRLRHLPGDLKALYIT